MPEVLPQVLENLSEEEAYLFAILSDLSGLDQAEFLWVDQSSEDNIKDVDGERVAVHPAPSGCFRAWAYQWSWWRDQAPLSVDQCARSVGKSLSVKVRACAFPFLYPGQEMVITAPELVHLEPIVSLIESQIYSTRTLREMIPTGKSAVTHRPFQMNFLNGARIIGRIPQRDGKGVKGVHPIWLEMDECIEGGAMVLTDKGMVPIEDVSVGARVWTHAGRWQPVTAVHDRGHREVIAVRGQGHPGLRCTPDHGVLVKPITHFKCPSRRHQPVPGAAGWRPADSVSEAFWASPLRPSGVPAPENNIPKQAVGPGCDVLWRSPDFLWAFGLFAAEGSLSSSYGTGGTLNRCYWSIHVDEVTEVVLRLKRAGLACSVNPVANTVRAANVLVTHQALAEWLGVHIGRGAIHKSLPPWVYSLETDERQAVLDGLVYGDGFQDPDVRYGPGRWKLTTASKALAVSARILAQSLGYHVSLYFNRPPATPSTIRGRAVHGKGWYQVVGNRKGQGHDDSGLRWTRVREVGDAGWAHVYDLTVHEDKSFVADGVVVHNSQDYPHAGWVELNETLKRGWEGAMWRVHGVTRGVRDDFYQITQDTPNNPWKIHRFAAMWRPNWTDQERDEAIQKYGTREDPDYRRNVLGLHGDNTNPIFVYTQLMKNVDPDTLSDYNTGEYFKQAIKAEQLEMFQQQIVDVLDFPRSHLDYAGLTPRERIERPKAHYWCGMDIGFTIDPSEILVFVEHRRKPSDAHTTLKLLTRVSMTRMPHRQQIEAILHTIDFYRPVAFAMDKGGVGLPLFQELAEHIEAFRGKDLNRLPAWMHRYDLEAVLTTIKGYHFGEKVLVDLDPSVEVGPFDRTEELVAKQGMRRNSKEYSTDVLREMVDRQQLLFPWDDDLLKQFQGGTWTSSRGMDAYGRRRFSQGNDHVLDAARMMALGWSLNKIEEMTKVQPAESIYATFIEL